MNQDSPNLLTKTMAFSSVLEIATGVALIVDPALVVKLLIGSAETSVQMSLARFPGIALFALGIACWPNAQRSTPDTAAFRGLLTYNVVVAFFLAYLFVVGHIGGLLLWPAVLLHALVAMLMLWAWRSEPRKPVSINGPA